MYICAKSVLLLSRSFAEADSSQTWCITTQPTNYFKKTASNTFKTTEIWSLSDSKRCCNDLTRPQDGTVALPTGPTEPLPSWSAVKTLKKSLKPPTPTRKPWKTKLWKLELRRLKKSMAAKELLLWSCFLWSIYIEQRESDGWVGTAAPQWPRRWMKMQMEGGGKLKPLVSLSAPLRLWCGTLSLSTSRTQPLRLHVPLACIATRPFTFFFFFLTRTNTWLLMLRLANDKRQMYPPQRIQFDKLLLHELFNNPKKPPEWEKEKSSILHENRCGQRSVP